MFFPLFIDDTRIYGNVFHKLPAADDSGSGRGAGLETRGVRVENSAVMHVVMQQIPMSPYASKSALLSLITLSIYILECPLYLPRVILWRAGILTSSGT